ncbi:hypothetical protein [Streptomyces sp. NPDC057552]|uniref:hypothetical protein n=1 Tax=Streptomyces sp. NPDC057552 TaxID=3350537 RepID=UPI00368B5548
MNETDVAGNEQEPEENNTRGTIQPTPHRTRTANRGATEPEPEEELVVLAELGDPEALEELEETSDTVTIQPARLWPVYNVSRARAELIAIEMLTHGVSRFRVCHSTKLSRREVQRLARLVAEEGRSPAAPRIVCRTPARPKPTDQQRATPTDVRAEQSAPEPLQMTFSIDC